VTPADFAPFVQAVHGFDPFPWQTRLLRRVVEAGWPAVLALPTAAGKTAAIDAAVFALALEVGRPLAERVAPLRTFFVIDRRLVVDQAARHARRLRDALASPAGGRGSVVVAEVAQALRRFGGRAPLHVAALRGGVYRDEAWAAAPNQPTVCVTTVDQIGSRLLFRGYGLSDFARPVHAGLAGNDALYLLDEAHLSQPFLETLRRVEGYRRPAGAGLPVGGPFRVVEISATPATPAGAGGRFDLGAEDLADPELSRRLTAAKPTTLHEPAAFEAEAARTAVAARAGEVKVVGVVVNRVASAREVFRRLPGEPVEDKVLLTGRVRPWDRDALLGRLLPRVEAGRGRRPGDRPLFVVATMTVEVGADLDFDYLVTEAAPVPALRQRFGRLDRLGRFGRAAGAVLLRKANGPDPVYGDDLGAAWAWLKDRAGERGGTLDFGIMAFDEVVQMAPPPAPAARHAPVMFPAHVDSWAQTSPVPQPTPDVAPFLHGPDALDAADVQVVWRADLDAVPEDADWVATVAAAPPRSREALPLPVQAVRDWLRRAGGGAVSDLEGVSAGEGNGGTGRPVVCWRGLDASALARDPGDIRPGDTVVVPASYGGADAYGWDPSSELAVPDVADAVVNAMADSAPRGGARRLVRLRLYPGWEAAHLPPAAGSASAERWGELFGGLRKRLAEGEDPAPVLAGLFEFLVASPPTEPLTAAVVRAMALAGARAEPYPAGVVLTARVAPGFTAAETSEAADEDEADAGFEDGLTPRTASPEPAPVTLRDHSAGVVRWVESFTGGLGVGGGLAAALARAAALHDLGKADWRFQYLLYGDEPDETPLAKSGRDYTPAQQAALRRRAGLPDGFRHEFVSAALVRRNRDAALAGLNADGGELAEYLVGVHHGRGRPFVPYVREGDPGGPETVRAEWEGRRLEAGAGHGLWRLDEGWADLFWRLMGRYGPWGLAYLEALLRLADGARSAEERRTEGAA
jgi:CRISPR-associated endonuclease/helicase Cas3